MKISLKKIFFRILKILGFGIVALLVLMLLLPILFQDAITKKIRKELNKNITTELYFQDSQLSFYRHFPSLTLSLDSISLRGSEPFGETDFIKASELSLSIGVFKLITSGRIDIDGIYLVDSRVNVQVDEDGNPNYNVFVEREITTTKKATIEEEVYLNLDIVKVTDAGLLYNDRSLNLMFQAKNLNYQGKGNYIAKDVELKSLVKVGSVDFQLENTNYLKNKSIEADLYTMYNSNSLSIVFEENDLTINNLNISFKGYAELLKNGYNVDLQITSNGTRLEDLFTALPPAYVTWKDKTDIRGMMDVFFEVKGSYIEAENKKPDVFLDVKLEDAYIAHQGAPIPVEDLYLDMKTKLPNLDIIRSRIVTDTISFRLNNDYIYGNMITEGGPENINIDGHVRANMNLDDLVKAIGIENYQLGGKLTSDFKINGTYNPSKKLFPKTNGTLSLNNGNLGTPFYPNAIQNINLEMDIENNDGTNKGTLITINEGNFNFENEEFNFIAEFENLDDLRYDVTAKGVLNISNIYKVFAQEDLEVGGKIAADFHLQGRQSDATKGNYDQLNNSGTLDLQNISLRSAFLPKAFIIREGKFQFNQDEMAFSDFKAEYASTIMTMNGYLKNTINYYLSDDEILQGEFSLISPSINTNEFMKTSAKLVNDTTAVAQKQEKNEPSIDTTSAGLVQVPTDLDLALDLKVQSLLFKKLEIKDLSGILAIKDGGLILKNGKLEMIGARAKMDGFYKNEAAQKAFFEYNIQIKDFDVKRAYNELEIFKVMAPAAEDAEGIISVDYKLDGVLDSDMQPLLPSLKGGGTLSVKNVQLKGYNLMGAVSKKTNKDALNDPDLSEVEIKSTLENNILNIEQFKFKVKPFKLKMEGQTSLTGDLNIKMRIGLPPFGIIGIPIKVTGNGDDPIIKLGKKTKDLEETTLADEDFSDLEKAKMASLKDSISDDMSLEEIEALQSKLDEMPEDVFYATQDTLKYQNSLMLKKDIKPANTTNPVNLTIVKRDSLD